MEELMNAEIQPSSNRKVGIGLGIGIVLIPILFSWFLLRKGHSTVSRVIGFVWLALTLVIIGHPTSKSSTTPLAASITPSVIAAPTAVLAARMTASALNQEYKENEVAADEKFKGQSIEVIGSIEEISKDFTNTMYLVINTGEFLAGIHAYFDDDHKSELASLKKGQRVVVRGTVSGYIVKCVMMKDCQLTK
jgi:hypothetical protein